jgi:hypothetical protein
MADGLQRLLKPSVERELLSELQEAAQKQAVLSFAGNLR